MKTRAVVAASAGEKLFIDEIDTEGPMPYWCLYSVGWWDDPEGLLPAVLGHEARAIVEEVGDGVTSLSSGGSHDGFEWY